MPKTTRMPDEYDSTEPGTPSASTPPHLRDRVERIDRVACIDSRTHVAYTVRP